MRYPHRYALLVAAMLLVIAAGALGDFEPIACVDDCADCADCPCCAPTRTPVLLAQQEGRVAEPCSTHETLESVRPSRSEERDVFHVPRPTA